MKFQIALVIIAIWLSLLLCGIELSSVATALPTIVHQLKGSESFAWVSAAYTLGASAVLPLSGRLAELFGRRSVLLASLAVFAIGTAIAGAAPTLTILLLGRAIAGLGSGGIQSLCQIVTADIVPLRKRGIYNALVGLVYSVTSVAGPFLGGAIVQRTTWRWLFYMNLPLCFIAMVVVFAFLRLKNPEVTDFWQKLSRLDIIGNMLFILSTVSCIIPLTLAGVQQPWTSAKVIVPLILGLLGLGGTILYEFYVASDPIMPKRILTNRTALVGYFMTFIHGLVLVNVAFYLPIYFQGAEAASPIASGLYFFPSMITASPFAMIQGILVSKTGKYRLIIIVGWSFMLVGLGLLSTLSNTTLVWISFPYQVIFAIGWAFLYATVFVILAPLEVTDNANALSLLVFARTFSQSWGVAIGSSILQNQLQHTLPQTILDQFPAGTDIAYSIIPLISQFPEALRLEIRHAFSQSLQALWRILLGFSAAGLLLVPFMKELPLQNATDKKWGFKEKGDEKPRKDTDKDKESCIEYDAKFVETTTTTQSSSQAA